MKKILLLSALLCFVFVSRSQVGDIEKSVALNLVQINSAVTGLTPADLNNSIVTHSYVIPGSDIRMVYLQQSYQGIPVYNQMQVLAFKADKLVSNAGGRLKAVSGLSRNANAVPAVSSTNAVQSSLSFLKIKPAQGIVALKSFDNGKKVDFGKQNISIENITAELIWLPVDESNELKLVWQVFVAPLNDQDYWLVRVDAKNNSVINKQSLTIKCNWDSEEHSVKNHVDKKHPVQNTIADKIPVELKDGIKTLNGPSVVNTASYRVVKYPAESPNHPGGANVLVTDPWLMSPGNATTLGWHDDGTTVHSITRGNNVYAYEDRNADNLPGFFETSSTPQPSLTFDFVPNFSLEPIVRTPAPNQQFNTTNLFYWNNLLHDLSYVYGFTESARNFQNNNQGRGGAGADYVLAESQDGSGTNNANFSTPADGGRGRMQMYLWTAPTPDRDGDVDNSIVAHEYAHGISNRFTGNGVTCLNNAEQMGEGWSDYIGLMITHDWAASLPGDGFSKPRGIATYALNQPITGVGLRQYRYTSDMAVNPLTYGNLSTVAVPHGVGTIWCTALWDMTWEIIQTQGINSNIFNIAGGGGNAIALKLVMEGMRLQPCSPGFIDGRNAILKADTMFFGAQYSCAIIKAFARRGMGIGAQQGSSNSRTDQTLSFVDCSSVTCNAPTGLTATAITATSATVNWTAVAGAVSYTVEYKLSSASTWTTAAAATTATSVNITGLTSSTLYDWRVRTNCSGGSSVYTQAQFTTAAATCNAPTGLTTTAITASSATVNWTAVSGAVSYTVEYKLSSASTWTTAAAATTATSVNITGLTSSTLYDWRVRTNCSGGSSIYTQAQFTTAAATCNAPTGLTTTAITATSATVNWTAVSGAVSYTVEYKLSSASTWTTAAAATTTTSVNITGLTSSTLYDWRVRTNCSGGSSIYTQAQFTTAAVGSCNAPTGLTTTAITSNSATINWAAVPGAVSYTIGYKLTTASNWNNSDAVITTLSANIGGLMASTAYDWRVRANCSGGSSAYAQAQFTTTGAGACNAPSGLTTTAITATGATVNWTAITGAVNYTVEYKLNSASTWTTAAAATTTTSVNITGLTASTLYDWRVRTNCSGGSSAYTQAQFTTAAAACNAPTGLTATGITATGATVNWNAVAGANDYTVEYKLNSASTWTTAAAATTATSVNISGLTASTLYDWRVRTNCAGGSSAYTQAQFTTAAAPCNAPTGLTATGITATGATVNWNAVAGANDYTVEYKLNSASTWTIAAAATTATSVNISGLTASTLYDWRVRSNCPGGSSAYTQAQFTTAAATCNAPAGLTATGITATGATVSWNAVAGASDYTVEYKLNSASTWTTAAAATTATSVNITGLTASTLYDWRVRTNCSGGSSIYSQAQFTTTGTASCNAPTGLNATAITTSGATLNWAAVPGAINYTVGFKLRTASSWNTSDAPIVTLSITIGGLSASTLYDWRVRANCSAGSSVYSQASFTTASSVTSTNSIGGDPARDAITKINVFPNPANQSVTVGLGELRTGTAELVLYDIYGKLLSKQRTSQLYTTVDISLLAAGTYIIRIKNDGKLSNLKIVKQK